MKLKYAVPAFLLLMAGCTSATQQNQTNNDIGAVQVALTGAEQAAKIYTDLPRCGSTRAGGSSVCSDPATVKKIGDLDNTAYNAVIAARSNSGLLAAAQAAITQLVSVVPAASAAK